MPIFEYRCEACGDEFEILVRGGEMDAVCPICRSAKLHKKFSVFGFRAGALTEMAPVSTSSSCGGCSSHNCGGCHH